MFASSSTSLRAITALPSQSARCLSTSANVLAKRKEMVELLAPVQGVGMKGDRVMVSPGYARTGLVPRRLARWVPNWRWFRITPLRVARPDKAKSAKASNTKEALLSINAPSKSQLAAQKAREKAEREALEPTPQDLLDRLFLLPNELVFTERTTEDKQTLHGSVTLANVSQRLIELDLKENEVGVEWQEEIEGARMKSVGEKKVWVGIKGKGKERVSMVVKVVSAVEEPHLA